MFTVSSNSPHLKMIDFKAKRLTKTLDRVMGQVLREAVRDWLRYILPRVPVDTGMAIHSFFPIGRVLRTLFTFDLPSITPRRDPYYSSLEGGLQGPDLGETKQEYELTHVPREGEEGRTEYIFAWGTETLHWFLKEHYDGSYQIGEEVVDEADQEMWRSLAERLERRLPEVADYLGLD